MIISTYLRRLQGAGVHVGCDMCPRSNMCPTKSLLTPETQFPFLPLCAWRTSPRPQACRIPGPPASFPPHLPTLILPASPQNSGCISQTLLAWTELSSSTEKVHLLLCRLGTLPNQGHVPLTSPPWVSGPPWMLLQICRSTVLWFRFSSQASPLSPPNALFAWRCMSCS